MKKKIIDSSLLSVLLTAIFAGLALIFTDTKSEWYQSLVQPAIQPPPIVFMIGWSILYILFAVSLALAMIHGADATTYLLFALQAACNVLWCLFYFTLHLPVIAFLFIVIYLVATYLTVRKMYSVSKAGALVLLPQIAWLIFATVLNYMTVLLN